MRGLRAAVAAGAPDQALGLYQGSFLDAVFVANVAPEYEEWVAAERVQLQAMASQAAWAMAERRSAEGDAAAAAGLARLLTFLDRSGDRAAALSAYQTFARQLREDFGAEPSPETQSLVRRIRTRTDAPVESPPSGGPPPVAADSGTAGPPAADAPTRWWSRPAAALVAGGLVISLLGAGWIAAHRGGPAVAVAVAVLPIAIEPADTSLRYLADGLTDRITDRLAASPGLRLRRAVRLGAGRRAGGKRNRPSLSGRSSVGCRGVGWPGPVRRGLVGTKSGGPGRGQ